MPRIPAAIAATPTAAIAWSARRTGSSDRLKSERDEPEQADRREQGAGQERKAGAGVAPREREPGRSDRGVEECEAK